MRTLMHIAAVLALGFLSAADVLYAQNGLDSLKASQLRHKLSEYYDALKYEAPEVRQAECDFLIESATDSLVRQFVALDIYRHYMESHVMGAENVAVHVFDKWFSTGKVRMKSDEDYMAAMVYAEFNRQSLLGRKAPSLTMEDIEGNVTGLFGDGDSQDTFRILYFYDTDCAKCKVETILLRNWLEVKDYPVELYAIYAGSDRESWMKYVEERFKIELQHTKVRHLWDPELGSDFQRKYGVIQTPRMLLVDPAGVIVGRGLDVKALEQMLDAVFAEKEMVYGADEAFALFDGIFSSYEAGPSAAAVKGIADYIADRTLARKDTLMFRQLSGDYLYYLSSKTGEEYKEGLSYHIDRNILDVENVWKSSDDSLKVVGFAMMMDDLLSRAEPGTVIPDIEVRGELSTWKKTRTVSRRLSSLKGERNIIIFYTEGCEVCAAEKKAASAILSSADDRSLTSKERRIARRTRVMTVNMDRMMNEDPQLASRLMDAFDLSSLPFIVITDRKGVIQHRYASLT